MSWKHQIQVGDLIAAYWDGEDSDPEKLQALAKGYRERLGFLIEDDEELGDLVAELEDWAEEGDEDGAADTVSAIYDWADSNRVWLDPDTTPKENA